MKKIQKFNRKLQLSRRTVRSLGDVSLKQAAGAPGTNTNGPTSPALCGATGDTCYVC